MRRSLKLAITTLPGFLSLLILPLKAAALVTDISTFGCQNGVAETYTVPAYATRLYVVAAGAAGGNGNASGSQGASISALLQVTPGETLNVVVGCVGTRGYANDAGEGGAGFASGGNGGRSEFEGSGGGGGGATAISRAPLASMQPLMVAAGGGGGGGGAYAAGGGRGGVGSKKGMNGNHGGGTHHAGGGGGGDSPMSAGDVGWKSTGGGGGGGGGGGFPGGGAGHGGSCGTCGGGGGGGGASYIDESALAGTRPTPAQILFGGGSEDYTQGVAPRSDGFVVVVPLKTWHAIPKVRVFGCDNGQKASFEVPSTTDNVVVLVTGARGGTVYGDGVGGDGAVVTATLPVTPGSTLKAVAGCRADDAQGSAGGKGYGNGGEGGDGAPYNDSGAGGGGGSAVLGYGVGVHLDLALIPLIVAGGGGGGGGDGAATNAGDGGGGGLAGRDGGPGEYGPGGSAGRGGGESGHDGSNGGNSDLGGGGGGGGGGYHGGTKGGYGTLSGGGGGGGGGSSFAAATATNVSIHDDTNHGNGSVVFTAPKASIPDPPTGAAATASGVTATVTFVAPTDNGGRPITTYEVTASPGGRKASGSTSPIAMTGLTPGSTYTFSVVAKNVIGKSWVSNTTNPVTMPVRPSAPTTVYAQPVSGGAQVFFSPSASDGGSPITSYTATANPGGITVTGTTSPLTFAGLTKFQTYTFTVRATNVVGDSPSASALSEITIYDAPNAPTGVGATGIDGTATVSFSASSDNGGSPTLNYSVTVSPGGQIVNGPSSPLSVSGLVVGTTYTFTVQAISANGLRSSASAPSNSLTMTGRTVPGAPTNVVACDAQGHCAGGTNYAWLAPSSLGELTVSFAPPTVDGGSAILSYTVRAFTHGGTPKTVPASSSPVTLSGLAEGPWFVSVSATNAIGTGPDGLAPAGGFVFIHCNDQFSCAQALSGASGSVDGNNTYSTPEQYERYIPGGNNPQQSDWYAWTAPANGSLTIDTCGSSAALDTWMEVYFVHPSGNANFHYLWRYTWNDNATCPGDSSGIHSRIVGLQVTGGTTYYIKVDSPFTRTGVRSANDYMLTWQFQ